MELLFLFIAIIFSRNLVSSTDVSKFGCQLRPISFGLYYGVYQKNMSAAISCCNSKGMDLAPLRNMWQRDRLRQALLSEAFYSEPIGPANGLYVATKPRNNQGYYPRGYRDKIRAMERRSTLSKPHYPNCSIAHLTSPRNSFIKITGVPCGMPFRYLCQQIPVFDIKKCHNLSYVDLVEDSYIYSYDKLSWANARDCCEVKGGELYRFVTTYDKEDLYTSLVHSAIIERGSNNTAHFWTGGNKKVDRSAFTWSNYDTVLFNPKENAEFCLQGVNQRNSITLQDHPCEDNLNFICRITPPKKCDYVIMSPISPKDSFRKYYYSGNYKLTWSEAVLCCRARGYQLLTVISPQEGNEIALFLQNSLEFNRRHQGLSSGLWTSGRRLGNGSTYEFVSVKTRTRFDKILDEHFIPGGFDNGTCLQYVVDARNSYFLNNIYCKSIRSFICEEPKNIPEIYEIPIRELGNKYFTTDIKLVYGEAYKFCKAHKMLMFDVQNVEEKKAMTPILKKLQQSRNISTGFWSTDPEPRTMSMDFNPKPIELKNKEIRLNSRYTRGRNRKYWDLNSKILPVHASEPNFKKFNNCSVALASSKKFVISSSENCSLPLHFICEYQDPLYGKCDTTKFTRFGRFSYNSKSTTWNQAEKCCNAIGLPLVTFSDSDKLQEVYEDFIHTEHKRPKIGFWTSGTNDVVSSKWIWSGDYTFVTENHFYNDYVVYDEPIHFEDSHECLEAFVDSDESKLAFDHDDCNIPKPFLCDESKAVVPKKCESIRFEQLRRTGFYYALSKVKWIHAQDCCMKRGMTLLEIHDWETNEKLHKFITEKSGDMHNEPSFGLWIGLTSHISNHSTFTWVDSLDKVDPPRFSNWNPPIQKPINAPDYCAMVYTGGSSISWKSVDCEISLRFVCQIRENSKTNE